jgi:cell division protein FtsI (penicillin-binding protein 3)
VEEKKGILLRIYLVYFAVCFFSIAIIYKISVIQFVEGDIWKAKSKFFSTKLRNIEATRGNIYDVNGVLLSTSLPHYDVAIDLHIDAMTDELFRENVDSLAYCLAKIDPINSKQYYKSKLVKARKNKNNRYLLLCKDVSYTQLQAIKKFPILRRGQNKGGFTYQQIDKRERLFQGLAARTIGKYNDEGTGSSYGLEIAYHNYLKGESGQRMEQKIAGGVWKPIDADENIKLEDGADIISTIDINLQDVASHSLERSLRQYNASHGCIVLMEVKTGKIKAIANLTKQKSGEYVEDRNYAVGVGTVPGSTFKLMSLVALMEDFQVPLSERVNIGNGTVFFSNVKVSDSHPPEVSDITMLEAFEQSSNVGVTKLITKYYASNPQKYIDRLYHMNLNTPLGISIPGEAEPYIKTTKDKSWSAISLPWISYGYETKISPLQILAFYNAIANNGKLVRPLFVEAIKKRNEIIKQFDTEVINPSICSKSTVDKAKIMMEGVVSNGTAKSLKAANYKIAGKTGTAQMGIVDGKMTYQASFAGYFPADNPRYSCIVVVSAPSGEVYYGSAVAGPVFKDVADKVYATTLDIHEAINKDTLHVAKSAPSVKNGNAYDLTTAMRFLNIKNTNADMNADWVTSTPSANTKSIQLSTLKIEEALQKNIVPNLKGMSAQDALYLLENHGLQVKLIGHGAVSKQSLQAGIKFQKGTHIILELI